MDWETKEHFEMMNPETEQMAMIFPAGEDGGHWWWAIFDSEQQNLITSGSDDDLEDAKENALNVLYPVKTLKIDTLKCYWHIGMGGCRVNPHDNKIYREAECKQGDKCPTCGKPIELYVL